MRATPFLLLLSLVLPGCTHSSETAKSRESPYGVTSLTKSMRKHGPPQRFEAPEFACPPSPEYPAATPVAPSGTDVNVQTSDGLVTFRVEGARVGEVVAALSSATQTPLFARGVGATVPIFANVSDADVEDVLKWLARASGMEVVATDSGFLLVDPWEAVSLRRREIASTTELAPIVTRVYEIENPARVARLVAWLVTSCRGDVISVPSVDWLIVRDTAARLATAESLVDWATAAECEPLGGEFVVDRRPTWGQPNAPAAACGEADVESEAGGVTVGSLIVRTTSDDVVVGCGGGRRVWTDRDVNELAEGLPRTLGLHQASDGHVYTALQPAEITPHELAYRVFQSEAAPELEVLVGEMFGDEVRTFVYHPHAALFVAGRPDLLESVAETIRTFHERAAR